VARAEADRRDLGFEPREVYVRSCEEHGTQAVSHAVYVGEAAGRQRYFREALTLRKSAAGWGVVPSPRFGWPS
jgi:hypothetical protein